MTTIQVEDVRALGALTHPLRNRLLALLRLDGPSTATLLGGRVGESSGTTSYHLRQLAAHGFIQEVPERGTGRERWWRAGHRQTGWTSQALDGQPGGAEVVEAALRHMVGTQGRLLGAWLHQRATLGPTWSAGSSVNDYALRLRPEQAQALQAELFDVLDRWASDHPSDVVVEGSERVAVLLDVLPLRDWPT